MGVRINNLRQSLTENPLLAFHIATKELSDLQANPHSNAFPRQVGQLAFIMTVDLTCDALAGGAGRCNLLAAHRDRDRIGLLNDFYQFEKVGTGYDGFHPSGL